MLQTEPHLLADYVMLALVFAELVGRGPAWSESRQACRIWSSL
jgi:hypothetical protein